MSTLTISAAGLTDQPAANCDYWLSLEGSTGSFDDTDLRAVGEFEGTLDEAGMATVTGLVDNDEGRRTWYVLGIENVGTWGLFIDKDTDAVEAHKVFLATRPDGGIVHPLVVTERLQSGYVYNQSVDIDIGTLTPPVMVDDTWDVELFDEVFPGGIQADNPFVTEFDGFLEFQFGNTDTYDFTLDIAHIIGDIEFHATRTSEFSVRSGDHFTLSLNDFNSRSNIQLGTFTPSSDDDPFTITEALLEEAARITGRLTVQRVGQGRSAFTVTSARTVSNPQAHFWQIASAPVAERGPEGPQGDPGPRGQPGPKGEPGADAPDILDQEGHVQQDKLGTGTPNASTVLYGDQTWQPPKDVAAQTTAENAQDVAVQAESEAQQSAKAIVGLQAQTADLVAGNHHDPDEWSLEADETKAGIASQASVIRAPSTWLDTITGPEEAHFLWVRIRKGLDASHFRVVLADQYDHEYRQVVSGLQPAGSDTNYNFYRDTNTLGGGVTKITLEARGDGADAPTLYTGRLSAERISEALGTPFLLALPPYIEHTFTPYLTTERLRILPASRSDAVAFYIQGVGQGTNPFLESPDEDNWSTQDYPLGTRYSVLTDFVNGTLATKFNIPTGRYQLTTNWNVTIGGGSLPNNNNVQLLVDLAENEAGPSETRIPGSEASVRVRNDSGVQVVSEMWVQRATQASAIRATLSANRLNSGLSVDITPASAVLVRQA